ncbi:ATP-binding protein [Schlesneria sp.]|uniref:sensor histidine kinase n=1 Tax=Schlesneria sp. TaxID=2762018 RepID=UPI002EE6E7AD
MFKSLRWRLQVWHAIVLLTVLTSFGGIVHSLHWQTRLQQIDAELDRTGGLVLSQLRRLLPRPSGGWQGGRRPPSPVDRPAEPRDEGNSGSLPAGATNPDPAVAANVAKVQDGVPPSATTQSDSSPRGAGTEPAVSPPPSPRRERNFPDPGPLPEEFQQLFQGTEDSRLYFVIWGGNGDLLQKSEGAPDIPYPDLHVGSDGLPRWAFRTRPGDHHLYREVVHAGMWNMNLLVGRSLKNDIIAHHRAGLLLAVAGLVILAGGVLGGGWLSARAILPISAMTATAESISAQNLSQRIDVQETDSELGQLASVLNRTFDRLQGAFERQSQFTADASHELRTPLSVISAHTELALCRPRSSEDYRAALETCRRAAQRMRSLIDSLLLLARFDSGTPSIKIERIDLDPLLRDCVEMVETLAMERNIHIECLSTSCFVRGDLDRLSQVFTNLLTNAIRYNVEGGCVRLTTRSEQEWEVISVIDSGVGIAGDQLSRIFDRFYQVDKARSRAEGSSGLGLSICKTIVDAHGGTIRAISQVGAGTTIEVRLPRILEPAALSRTTNHECEEALVTK